MQDETENINRRRAVEILKARLPRKYKYKASCGDMEGEMWRYGRRDEPENVKKKARWREERQDEPENIKRKARGIIKYTNQKI